MLEVDLKEMALLAINLLVLFFILRKFLFRPVTNMIESRQKLISDQLADAASTKAEAEQLHEEYGVTLAAAGQQARDLIANAKTMSERDYQAAMDKAKAEAQSLLVNAQAQIERERAEMLDGVRREVATLAILAASRVSAGRLNADTDNTLLDAFLEETGNKI